MKIAVYAIAKNEEHNVQKWCDSNKDADIRIVCDTGSDDNTVQLLKDNGVIVHQISVSPWRFDTAKNIALDYIPEDYDIAISQDLDEELLEGWREELEPIWKPDVTNVNHKYRNNNNPWQWHSKIHNRKHCKWTGAVHETLEWSIPENLLWTDKIFLDEKQDFNKNRSGYLELLLQKIEEGDKNWRTFYFLANEYFGKGDIENAIKYKISAHEVCDEGGISKAYISKNIARDYILLNDYDQVEKWFSISFADSNEKENWYEYANYYYKLQNWEKCLEASKRCINIKERRTGFTFDKNAWGEMPYDFAALSCYHLEKYKEAIEYGEQAIVQSPHDERLYTNLTFYKTKAAENMKVAIYTIALNEEQFVERWYESAKDADYLLIADTGSTDGTIEKAKALDINIVEVKVSPWRFDDARNAAMAAIPLDIDYCISLDMDEIITPNWRDKLKIAYIKNITRPVYKHVWSWNSDGTPGLEFSYDHIHARKNYRWKHPVHECLYAYGKEETRMFIDGLETHHHPDPTKSRSQYLPLLRLSVQEDPYNDRNAFYYARELYFYKHFDDAISEFKRYLNLPTATWRAERSAAYRFMAKCSEEHFEGYMKQAIEEDPIRREAYVDLAMHYYKNENWLKCLKYAELALKIEDKPLDYLCESFAWNETPYDLASIASFNLGGKKKAIKYVKEAIKINPNDQRLKNNLKWYNS
jgi:glycosyltransferase involved in cell wall biosynthesis